MSRRPDLPSVTLRTNAPAKQSAWASVRIVGYFSGSRRSASGVMPIRFCTAWPISCASTTTTAASPKRSCSTGSSDARSQAMASAAGQ